MVGPDDQNSVDALSDAWRKDWAGEPPHSFLIAVLLTYGSQSFSPAKVIFTGIGVLLIVSLSRSSLSPIRVTSELPGCEGCSYESQHARPPLRAYSLLPSTLESLHRGLLDGGINAVTWESDGTVTLHPRPFNQYNGGKQNE